jgi:hypothetical protein
MFILCTLNEVVLVERLWICGGQLWNTGGRRILSAAGRESAFTSRLFAMVLAFSEGFVPQNESFQP